MKRGSLSLIAALTLVGLVPLGVSDAPVDEDRSFDYLGTAHFETGLMDGCDEATGDCPFFLPSGARYADCDHSDGVVDPPGGPTQWDGIGGGVFCHIRKETNVTVTIHDLLLEQPSGIVTCPSHGGIEPVPPDIPGWPLVHALISPLDMTYNLMIGKAEPSLTFEVSEDCWTPPRSSHKLADEATEIGVFLDIGGGATGTVTLEYND